MSPHSSGRPARVRVSAPAPRRPGPGPGTSRRRQIDRGTDLGEVLLRSLLRDQLRLAARVLLPVVVVVAVLPILFRLLPNGAGLLDVPVPWLVLAVLIQPCLFALGWWYVRRAEANEAAFRDLVESDH